MISNLDGLSINYFSATVSVIRALKAVLFRAQARQDGFLPFDVASVEKDGSL